MQDTSMLRDSLDKISKMERFNQRLYENIKPFLGNRVLDAGCGNGNITKFLEDKELLIAVDNNSLLLKEIKNRLSRFTNLEIIESDIASEQFTPLVKEKRIDTILCINMLEHTKDDLIVIKNFYDILEPNGKVIIFVPALKFLFSSLDEAAGHIRRYSKREIVQKLIGKGFSIQYITYFNLFGAFGWFLHSKILKKREFSKCSLNLFNSLMKFFIFFEKILRTPFGLSLLIIGRKIDTKINQIKSKVGK